MDLGNGLGHLTYSTLVHPGDTWAEMWDSLNRYVPQVKARVSSEQVIRRVVASVRLLGANADGGSRRARAAQGFPATA